MEEDILKKILRRLEVLNSQMNDVYEKLCDITDASEEDEDKDEDEDNDDESGRYSYCPPSFKFWSRSEAERASEQILKVFKTYRSVSSFVSVATVCNICGAKSNIDDYRWGWKNLPDDLVIVRTSDFMYTIILPTPQKL